MAIGYEEVEMSVEDEGCSTPTREEYRIQVGPVPPPPPRKKPVVLLGKKRVVQPENGYFQAPDLEMLFAVNPIRRQACA